MRLPTALLTALPLPCPPPALAEPRLETASGHPMRYYLAEPPAPPERVLVCIAGAGANFRGAAVSFSKASAGSRVLVVVPCTFSSSNAVWGQVRERYRALYGEAITQTVGGSGPVPDVRGRLAWDETGLLAVLADLRARFPTAERVYLTGFSAGGLLAWWMAMRHPTLLDGVVPVCPNHAFWAVGEADVSPVPEGARSVPVRVLSGGRDPLRHSRIGLPVPPVGVTLALGVLVACVVSFAARRLRRRWVVTAAAALAILVPAAVAARLSGNHVQTDIAVRLLERLGHDVEWTYEPGLGHEPAPERVLKFVSAWR